MAANGLGIILFQYAEWLLGQGYCRNTIHQYTHAVEHFGFWRAKRHPFSQGVTPSEVEEFSTSHLSRCHCPQPAVTTLEACRPALNRLMTMLGCRKPSARSDEETGAVGTLISPEKSRAGKKSSEVHGLSR
jgi:hypothetical protein